jgi:hypothetical protein
MMWMKKMERVVVKEKVYKLFNSECRKTQLCITKNAYDLYIIVTSGKHTVYFMHFHFSTS